jgi:hypothetical protein
LVVGWLTLYTGAVFLLIIAVFKNTYNNNFDIKLEPEFFDATLMICITFPDKLGEGSMQVISFKILPVIGY